MISIFTKNIIAFIIAISELFGFLIDTKHSKSLLFKLLNDFSVSSTALIKAFSLFCKLYVFDLSIVLKLGLISALFGTNILTL